MMLPKKCYPLLVVSMGLGTRPSVNKVRFYTIKAQHPTVSTDQPWQPFILVHFSKFFARYIPSHA